MRCDSVVTVESDVLIIGGGLAGCMAAIRASEFGVCVVLVEKSNTLASGCAAPGIDHAWAYIPEIHEPMGYSIEDMAEDHRIGIANGFFRKDLFMLVARNMYDRMLDLEGFGIRIRYEDSKIPGGFRIVQQFHSVPTSFNFDGAPLKRKLTEEAKRRGVTVINRVQMTDLLSTDGQISGAVGLNTRTGELYFFRTKAAILCTGRSNRLSRNPTGIDFNTRIPSSMSGDGTSIAMRLGLPIINIEFLSGTHLSPCGNYNPNYGDPRNTVQPAARIVDWEGKVLVPRTRFYDWEKLGREKWTPEVRRRWLEERRQILENRRFMLSRHREGGGPFYLDFSEATDEEIAYIEWSISNESKGRQFLRYFKGEERADFKRNSQEYAGFWPRELSGTAAKGIWVNENLETDVGNLFGAGDEVGGLPWASAPGALAMGWYSGEMAAKRARKQRFSMPVSDELLKARQSVCGDMLERKRGFHWKEIELYVQNVVDFYCGDLRSEPMLKRGLERLKDARSAPMRAENFHELGRCHDVLSIIDNAELVFRSSLERRESRPEPFEFRRADYPNKDDSNWFCFLAIQRKGENFLFRKIPIE